MAMRKIVIVGGIVALSIVLAACSSTESKPTATSAPALAPTILTPIVEGDQEAPSGLPSFFAGVLDRLGIERSNFALAAMETWAGMENTRATWNPLATTWKMTGSTAFNSAGVQNYPDQATGIEAAANTLALAYYDAIRAMLREESIVRERVQDSLNTWSGNGAYVPHLLAEWATLWVNQANPSQPPPEKPGGHTEFYLRDTQTPSRGPFRELKAGEHDSLLVGITNNEEVVISYGVVITLEGSLVQTIDNLVLEPGETWEQEVRVGPVEPGPNQDVQFSLFKGDEQADYSSLRVWLEVGTEPDPTTVIYYPEKLWEVSLPVSLPTNQVSVDRQGTIYSCTGDVVVAIDRNGVLRWTTRLADTRCNNGLAVGHDGTIFVPGNGRTYVLDTNGQIVGEWSISGRPYLTADAIYFGGQNHITAYKNKLTDYNGWGSLEWTIPTHYGTGLTSFYRLAFSGDGAIYAYSTNISGTSQTDAIYELYRITPNGKVDWVLELDERQPGTRGGMGPFVSSDGTVYVVTRQNKRMYAVSPEGTVLWSKDLETPLGTENSLRGAFVSPEGTAYIYNGVTSFAMDANGETLWESTMFWHATLRGLPDVTGTGTLIAGNDGGTIFAHDQTGKTRWEVYLYQTGDRFRGIPTVKATEDGRVYVVARPLEKDESTLYAFGPASFTQLPRTLHVFAGDGNKLEADHHFESIQEAIDLALPGGAVLVHGGDYRENVVVDRPLTLRGLDLPTIDARGNGSALWLQGGRADVAGFRLTGAAEISSLFVTSSYNIIERLVIEDNASDGLELSLAYYNRLSDIQIRRSNWGVNAPYSSSNTFRDIQTTNNVIGFYVYGVENTLDCVLSENNSAKDLTFNDDYFRLNTTVQPCKTLPPPPTPTPTQTPP